MGSKISSLVYYLLFEYDTPKIVHIKSKTVGIINRLIQLIIIGYIIGWVIVYNHGYQEFSTLQSSVTTKVKGAVYTNDSVLLQHQVSDSSVYNRIWDVADYIIPSQENGAFFVMTNVIITPNQTIGVAASLPDDDTNCTSDADCTKGRTTRDGSGVMTGICVQFDESVSFKTCQVHAWTPLEIDQLPKPFDQRPLLEGTENFTVLIKNSIRFALWPNYRTRNVVKSTNNDTYLKSCNYDDQINVFCPIFKLGSVVKSAGENYTQLATKGGVMGIMINWDCNLDFNIENCVPKYSFKRLDDPDVKVAPGWNFRFAHFYGDNRRTLYKAYGILFVIMVEGHGRKFNVMPLFLNVGSGLALLSIAVVVCDIIVLYFMRKRDYYREQKYLLVNGDSETSQNQERHRSGSVRSRERYQTFGEESTIR